MPRVLLVAAGGAIGSAARYLLSGIVQGSTTFPIGTFVVNAVGCLVVGVIAGFAFERTAGLSVEARVFLMSGVCGGFTTFSAFSYETLQLMRSEQFLWAALNVGGQFAVGLLAVWVGMAFARMV